MEVEALFLERASWAPSGCFVEAPVKNAAPVGATKRPPPPRPSLPRPLPSRPLPSLPLPSRPRPSRPRPWPSRPRPGLLEASTAGAAGAGAAAVGLVGRLRGLNLPACEGGLGGILFNGWTLIQRGALKIQRCQKYARPSINVYILIGVTMNVRSVRRVLALD